MYAYPNLLPLPAASVPEEAETVSLPDTWGYTPPTGVIAVRLETSEAEYQEIEQLLHFNCAPDKQDSFLITGIFRVQNRKLFRKYAERCQRLLGELTLGSLNEKRLLHGTKVNDIETICSDGFDPYPSGSSSNRKYLERGIYFTPYADVANDLTFPANDIIPSLVYQASLQSGTLGLPSGTCIQTAGVQGQLPGIHLQTSGVHQTPVTKHLQLPETQQQSLGSHSQLQVAHQQSSQSRPQLPEAHLQSFRPNPQLPGTHQQSFGSHPQVPVAHQQSFGSHPQVPVAHQQSSGPLPQVPGTHQQSFRQHPQVPGTHQQLSGPYPLVGPPAQLPAPQQSFGPHPLVGPPIQLPAPQQSFGPPIQLPAYQQSFGPYGPHPQLSGAHQQLSGPPPRFPGICDIQTVSHVPGLFSGVYPQQTPYLQTPRAFPQVYAPHYPYLQIPGIYHHPFPQTHSQIGLLGASPPFHGTQWSESSTNQWVYPNPVLPFADGSEVKAVSSPAVHVLDKPKASARYMLVAKVLLGRVTTCRRYFTEAPNGFHSCVDNLKAPSKYVVYQSNQAYPEYIIQYQQKEKS